MKLFKDLIISISLVYLSGLPAEGKELAITGRTYPISERDALEEVEERAKSVNWQKHLKSIKPENYRPANLPTLPRAQRSRKFLVDMTYTLENDIVNDKGELLYRRGIGSILSIMCRTRRHWW
ncbi:hypothetical protein [Geobacter anodireducens]